MADSARRLEGMIAAVEAEKAHADIERRHVMAKTRNAKAQRLVARLEQCDQGLATLLSDAAGCLETFVESAGSTSTRAATQSRGHARDTSADRQDAEDRLQNFEVQAQDWFSTLNDVQLGLRSAVRNLRKAQRVPIAHDAGTRSAMSTDGKLGSATKGHSLALVLSDADTNSDGGHAAKTSEGLKRSNSHPPRMSTRDVWRQSQQAMRSGALDDNAGLMDQFTSTSTTPTRRDMLPQVQQEAALSLSALRLQDDSWKQLEEALSSLAMQRRTMGKQGAVNDPELDALMMQYGLKTYGPVVQKNASTGLTNAGAQQVMRDMVQQRLTRDNRLIDAVLHLNMEFLPELAVSPMRGPAAPQSTA